MRVCKTPIKFSNADVRVTGNPPLVGEHNREVLGTILGLSEHQIDELTQTGILVEEDSNL